MGDIVPKLNIFNHIFPHLSALNSAEPVRGSDRAYNFPVLFLMFSTDSLVQVFLNFQWAYHSHKIHNYSDLPIQA